MPYFVTVQYPDEGARLHDWGVYVPQATSGEDAETQAKKYLKPQGCPESAKAISQQVDDLVTGVYHTW